MKTEHTFTTYALPQLIRELFLGFDTLLKVDVDIETTTSVIGDWIGESVVGRALLLCRWIDIRFAIFTFLAA